MKLAFASTLILLCILAPIYILPRIFTSDSGESLIEAAANDIAAQVSGLRDIRTISVQPIEGDQRDTIKYALVNALWNNGRLAVREPRDTIADGEQGNTGSTGAPSDAILKCRIERHEILGKEERLTVRAIVRQASNGNILWSDTWNGAIKLHGPELDLHKTSIIIWLALAAGILIIFARKEDQSRETIRQW